MVRCMMCVEKTAYLIKHEENHEYVYFCHQCNNIFIMKEYKELWCPNCGKKRMYVEGRVGPVCSQCGCESFANEESLK